MFVQSAVQLLLGSLGVGLLAVVCYVSMSLRLAIVCLIGGVSGRVQSVRGVRNATTTSGVAQVWCAAGAEIVRK